MQTEDQRGRNAHRIDLWRKGQVLRALPLSKLLQLRGNLLLSSKSAAQRVLRAPESFIAAVVNSERKRSQFAIEGK